MWAPIKVGEWRCTNKQRRVPLRPFVVSARSSDAGPAAAALEVDVGGQQCHTVSVAAARLILRTADTASATAAYRRSWRASLARTVRVEQAGQ